MHLEGSLEPFRRLKLKQRLLQRRDPAHKQIRPVLLVLGGVMRGVYAGGQLTALDAHGLRGCFDTIVGVSTGVPTAAYFLAGHIRQGTTIYWNECTTDAFMSYWRALRGKRIVDVDHLAAVFRGQTKRKVGLDTAMLRRSRTDFHVATTCGTSGEGVLIDVRSTLPDPVEAIRAAVAMPTLSHGRVMIGGRRLLDGAGAMPFPARHVIGRFDPTDLIVLANRPPSSARPSGFKDALGGLLLLDHNVAVRRTFITRRDRFMEELSFLRAYQGCNSAILWTDDRVGHLTRDSRQLRTAAERAEAHLDGVLRAL